MTKMKGLHDRHAAELLVGYGEGLANAMDLPPGFAITRGWDALVDHAASLRESVTRLSSVWMSMPDSEIARCVDEWKARKQAEPGES